MIASPFCSNELFVIEHVIEQMSHQLLCQRLQHSERLKNHSWITVQNYEKREMRVFHLNKSNVSVLFHMLIDSAYPESDWHSLHSLVYWTINSLDKGLAKLELREPAPGLRERREVFVFSKQGVCQRPCSPGLVHIITWLPLCHKEGLIQVASDKAFT